ncbi:MAG: hypothetical protein ABSB82_03260 [Terriglobia bacterium]|jgi:hypothetical protein
MEAVGQNATLFPKSQISANFISAQALYLRYLEKLVSKVSKVSIVTFGGSWFGVYYYVTNIPKVIFNPRAPAALAV